MAIIIKSKMHGMQELSKQLRDLPDAVERRVVQAATKKAMEEALPDIIAAAPVGPIKSTDGRKHRTAKAHKDWQRIVGYGKLKDNISIYRMSKLQKGQKGTGIGTGDAFWGAFYEFGTRHQPARPFFAPAFKAAYGKIINRLTLEIGKGIEKQLKK